MQQATFGRLLTGTPDGLTGFVVGQLEIADPEVIAGSGLTHHRILHPADSPTDSIPGTVYRITDEELAAADVYEAEEYRRVLVPLTSGLDAWVYIAA